MKQCLECQSEKNLMEFYIKKSGRPMSRCKECEKKMARTRAKTKYDQNPTKSATERRKRYDKQDKSNKQISVAKWQQTNPQKRKQILHKYYKNNIEIFRSRNHRRRARVAGNGGSFSPTEWILLKEQYGNICLCCGKKESEAMLTPDHVLPISKGGTSFIENIQPLCNTCNKRKSDKTIDYRR